MKIGDTLFNGNQFKNVILNSTSYKRLILGVNLVWSYFSIAIKTFKTRISADGGTYESESILEDKLQEITPNLFDSASLVITPNGVKTSKLYTIKPNDGTGDLTVLRNTSATRIDENGNIVDVSANVARIDYTTGNPAILVEPQRTNLLQRSEEFNNGYWGKFFGVISENSIIAPNGTMTADLFTKTSAINSSCNLAVTNVYSTTGIHTLSVFVKPNVGNLVLLRLDASSNTANAAFNFTTKTFTNTGANIISSSFKEFPNGWFRLTVTGNVISTNWIVNICSLFPNPTNDSMYIWGAQLEAGSNATSYIPTTTSSVTRNADIISKSGISNLIGQTEGTMYWEGKLSTNAMTIASLRTDSGIVNGVIFDIESDNRIKAYIAENNVLKNIIPSLSAITFNSFIKIAYVYKSGNCSLFINGVKQNTSSQTFAFNNTISRVNIDYIGYNYGAAQGKTKYVKNCIVFPTVLTDQQCISLTTL